MTGPSTAVAKHAAVVVGLVLLSSNPHSAMEEIRRYERRHDGAIRHDERSVSSVSARLAPTSAHERGDAARQSSRTTVVQHDEHQRDPTSADDRAVHRSRFARSSGRTPMSAYQRLRASVHS